MDVGLVCDSCSTFNPMGVKSCASCGDNLSLDDPRPQQPFADKDITQVGIEMTLPASEPCPMCGHAVTASLRFCSQCGARMPEANKSKQPAIAPNRAPSKRMATRPARRTQFFGAMQATRAKLVVIRGDGMDGISFTLAGDDHLVGRDDTPIQFDDDPYLSPVHANFYYDDGTLMVRDEDSANGIYLRIHGSVPIKFGTRFLVGEQVLEVHKEPDAIGPQAIDDGTYYFTSPVRPAHFNIEQKLNGGTIGLRYASREPTLVIGREDNQINFPDDPFISGTHAQVSLVGSQLSLTDLDSKNGTFLCLDQEHPLKHGDYVFMGQQLLRVEIV